MNNMKHLLAVILGANLLLAAGCGTLDRAYNPVVTSTPVPQVQVVTNTLLATNYVVQVTQQTNVVFVTNAVSGAVTGYATVVPAATNVVPVVSTNYIPVYVTNVVQLLATNLAAKPAVDASIQAAGSLLDLVLPGIGSLVALVLGGAYHGYQQLRNRKVNAALVQGIETARAVLETTPQGQAADAQVVKWLMDNQKAAGVFATVSTLVDRVSDNPAARIAAQEIAERVQRAEQARPLAATSSCPNSSLPASPTPNPAAHPV